MVDIEIFTVSVCTVETLIMSITGFMVKTFNTQQETHATHFTEGSVSNAWIPTVVYPNVLWWQWLKKNNSFRILRPGQYLVKNSGHVLYAASQHIYS